MAAPATGGTVAADGPGAHERSLRGAAYLTVGVGVAHALLFLLSYWLILSAPDVADSAAMLRDIYRRRLTLVGLYVMPFSGIAFIWFIVALRMWISGHQRRENVLHSNIQLVSGILYVTLFFIAGAAAATSAASVEFAGAAVDQMVTPQFPRFASTLLFIFAVRMAAMFVFTTSNIARGTGVLPRWFVFVGFAVGLFLLLSASFSRALVFVFPVWMLVLCALLLRRARQIPAGVPLPPPGARAAFGRGGAGP